MRLKVPGAGTPRQVFQTINQRLDATIPRWAPLLAVMAHVVALLVVTTVPQSPIKNALVAALVLSGFAVPATWVAAAAGTRKLRRNGWRAHVKALYILWVPLAAFTAYWGGGIVAQLWYGGALTSTYYYTSLIYAPFSFLLQWKLASRTGEQKSVKESATQQPSRLQRFMLHPITSTASVALAVMLLFTAIQYGIVSYLPTLLHQRNGSNASNSTLTLTSLNSLVIILITSACRLRRTLPVYREYVRRGTRTRLEIRVARLALTFGIAWATLEGTLVAALIYGIGFETSQLLSNLGTAAAWAVYGKELVSNTLWLLVPLINSREQTSEETARTTIMQFLARHSSRLTAIQPGQSLKVRREALDITIRTWPGGSLRLWIKDRRGNSVQIGLTARELWTQINNSPRAHTLRANTSECVHRVGDPRCIDSLKEIRLHPDALHVQIGKEQFHLLLDKQAIYLHLL
jgi:hypothetical protein